MKDSSRAAASYSNSAGQTTIVIDFLNWRADLVQRHVAAIITHGPAVSVARAVTSTTPIIFVIGDDPVKMGFVASLNRPEANVTGITFFGGGQLGAKRLELLRELVPKVSVVAILLDPEIRGFETELPLVQAAGRALGTQDRFG